MMSISYSKSLVTLFCALALLQTATALPTRGSYGQLARRAGASQKARRANAPSMKLRRSITVTPGGPTQTAAPAIAPLVRIADAAAVENVAAAASSSSSSAGGDYYAWASAAGVPATPLTSGTATAVSSPFVAAENVTLPTASSSASAVVPKLTKRVTAHPGAPTQYLTAEVNVINAANETGSGSGVPTTGSSSTYLGFTLINATSTQTATATSAKVAQTSKAVNIIQNITSSASEKLPTITQTLTLTLSPTIVETVTATLVPTVVAGDNSTSYTTLSASSDKTKRQVIAFFEAPKQQASYSREEMLSEEWEDCVVGVDADCLELPAASVSARSYSRADMMSEEWEDCIVGVDAGCIELPEN